MTLFSPRVGGFYDDGGYTNSAAGQNYYIGISTIPAERRHFITFIVPSAPMPVASAVLKLHLPSFPPAGPGFLSPDPSEHYRVSSTTVPASTIISPTLTTTEAIGIFGTLGSGTLYGETDVFPSMMGGDVVLTLSAAAVADVNSLLLGGGGAMVMGGKMTAISGTVIDEILFGYSDLPSPHWSPPRLELTFVPAPAVGALLPIGVVALTFRRRR